MQTDETVAPVVVEYLPEPHEVQLWVLVEVEYLPAGHARHVLAAVEE